MTGTTRTILALLLGALLGAAAVVPPAAGQDPDEPESGAPADSAAWHDEEPAEASPPAAEEHRSGDEEVQGPWPRFAALAGDTLRTNLWLARALLADAAATAARALPPPPRAVVLRPTARHDANPLLVSAARAVLGDAGYELFLDETQVADAKTAAAPPQAPADAVELRVAIEEFALAYPRAGRRFGLWRQWVDRRLRVVALVTAVERGSGRVLYDERVVRSFEDRIAAGSFDEVRSTAYKFTDAEVPEGGWRRRAEEAVVIGTLVGLVAVYFANTGR